MALALVGGAAIVWPQRLRIWLDRLILVALAAMAIGVISGLPLILISGGPADPLHFVYALVAPALIAGARYLGHDVDLRRRAILVTAAAVALLGVVYRLFATG